MNLLDTLFYYMLCFYVIILPFSSKLTIKGRALPLADSILALIILFYLIKVIFFNATRKKFIDGLKDFFTSTLGIFITMLLGIMLFSITYSVDKSIAKSESARFLSYIILYFIIKYECNLKKHLKGLLNSYIFVAFLVSIVGIYGYFLGTVSNSNLGLSNVITLFGVNFDTTVISFDVKRAQSVLENPNNLAAFLMLSIFPVVMIFIKEKKLFKKVMYFLIICTMTFAGILTFSRNLYIALIIGSVVLIILYSWKLIFSLGAFGLLFLLIPQVRDRLMDIGNPAQDSSRIKLWGVALKMIKDHPILGIGNGNFVSLYDTYVKKYPYLEWVDHHKSPSHNSYLKIQSELGILGSISFLGILITILFRIKKFITDAKDGYLKWFYTGFLASVIAFYCMNLFDNLFFVPKTTSYFWILVAVLEASIYWSNENNSKFKYL